MIHITRTPMKTIHDEPDGERWCFSCRARREFRYIVKATVEPSCYGPDPSIRCGTCGLVDGDLFPGRTREWGAP